MNTRFPYFVAAVAVSFSASLDAREFTALFNGKNLDGWYGWGTKDPRELWKLSDPEADRVRKDSLADIRAHWKAEDGELVNDGKGLYLTTVKDYRDFELWVDYRTVVKADSGIYLRGIPQVQIWDPTDESKWNLGANKGSGGLWNNSKGAPGKDPSKRMDRPFGEWNSFQIRMIGERVHVDFNGETVVDNAVLENYFEREIPAFAQGPIQLQTHGGEIRWRNVFVREIDSEEANAALWEMDGEGFTDLFNGRDLEGWVGAVDSYEVRDGAIVCKKGSGGTLYAKDEYEDFVFRFEFRLPEGGNNGVAIRAPLKGDPAWEAFEIQTLDNTAPKYAKLKEYQYHGSVYGLVPAHRGYLRPLGEWNFQEIHVEGSRIRVTLNGTTIVNTDIGKIDLSKIEGRIPKGVERTKGYVGFAGHSDPVEMRKVRIKRL